MKREIKIYEMDELLTVVEGINKALIGIEADVDIIFGAKDNEIEQIAKQENETFFKPSMDVPHAWASVKLGKVSVIFRGADLERKFIK